MITDKEYEALQEHYCRSMELCHEWGVHPFETDFHIVPPEKIYEIASYGIPGHFSHWSYGRDFWRQKASYDYGHSKIYELVINADPAQAFLLENNSLTENCVVISHVVGHSFFFRQNQYFAHTNRKILQTAEATADRFRQYEIRYGRYVVEDFIDDVMTVCEHIDPHLRTRHKDKEYEPSYPKDPYGDLFPETTELQEAAILEYENRRKYAFPFEPEKDIVKFVAEYGHLDDWQRDVMLSMREESLYFLPQTLTSHCNEGTASVFHRLLMHHIDPSCDPGGFEFAQVHSGVLSNRPGILNRYWLGYNILMRIIQVYGDHSDQDMTEFKFLEGPSDGWKKVLEVIEEDNDQSLMMNYLDKETCEKLDLFAFAFKEEPKQWEITNKSWEEVRDILVSNLTNASKPYIAVEDGNYHREGKLYLKHHFDGRPLKMNYALKTLKSLERLWGRTVLLETNNGKEVITLTS